jgi:hypothetical protein
LGSAVLVLVVGLDGGDLFEGDFLGGLFVDLLLHKTIQMSPGQYHPALLPFFEDAGSLDEKSFFDFIIFDIDLVVLL